MQHFVAVVGNQGRRVQIDHLRLQNARIACAHRAAVAESTARADGNCCFRGGSRAGRRVGHAAVGRVGDAEDCAKRRPGRINVVIRIARIAGVKLGHQIALAFRHNRFLEHGSDLVEVFGAEVDVRVRKHCGAAGRAGRNRLVDRAGLSAGPADRRLIVTRRAAGGAEDVVGSRKLCAPIDDVDRRERVLSRNVVDYRGGGPAENAGNLRCGACVKGVDRTERAEAAGAGLVRVRQDFNALDNRRVAGNGIKGQRDRAARRDVEIFIVERVVVRHSD